jgi:GAF domain-containing protein
VPSARQSEVGSAIGLEELAREQAALRRVATLVAEAAPADELFAAVAEELGSVVLEADVAFVARYEAGEALEFLGGWNRAGAPAFVGQRVRLGGRNVSTLVFERNAPVRVDHLEDDAAPATALAREWARCAAGAPINVEGRLWGVMIVGSLRAEGLPRGIEDRLADFTDLIATAIANTQARDDLRRLAEEQASLRRVATLVAEGASPDAIFAAVVDEVAQILGLERIEMARYEADGTATVIGASGDHPFPPGSRWELDGPSLLLHVQQTGRPARIDDYGSLSGTIAAVAHEAGFRSAIGAPIIVDGRPWGAIIAISTEPEPIPERSEARLAQFTDLIATAIANTQAHDDLRRLAEEQASFRRLATLVAQGASRDAIFAAVVDEVAEILGLERIEMARYEPDGTATMIGASRDHPFPPGSQWPLDGPSLLLRVKETGRPARIDDYGSLSGTVAAVAREAGFRSGIGAPLIVEGETWGAIFAMSTGPEPIPERSEERLAQITDLVALAISNATARAGLTVLVDEQAALRRVATLVARGAPPPEIFSAVAEEVGGLLGPDHAVMARFDAHDVVTIMAEWTSTGDPPRLEKGRPLSAGGIAKLVQDTGRPARVDDYASAARGRQSWVLDSGTRAAVAAPITVDGRLWGVMGVGSRGAPPSTGTEARLAHFTELVATAIANTQAREELRTIADEQAALRRVATLVAGEASPSVVFAAVTSEAGGLFGAQQCGLLRYEEDGTATVVGQMGMSDAAYVGTHIPLGGRNVTTLVSESGRSARLDSYLDGDQQPISVLGRTVGTQSAVGAPVSVAGRLWGVLVLGSDRTEFFPTDTEERLAGFTELVGTGIANSQARAELSALVDEQAALRRVATLVAEEAPPQAVFAAVSAEGARLFDAQCALERYDPGGIATIVGLAASESAPPIGTQVPLGGHNAATLVFETGRPARIDSFPADDTNPLTAMGRAVGKSAVGAPINVAGRLWGVLAVNSERGEPFAEDTEERLEGFADLVATAIANSQARGEASALADEQAALRRVATLVAEEAPPEAVFAAVSAEAARLFDAECGLMRYDDEGSATIVAGTSGSPAFVIGTTVSLGGQNTTTRVYETGRPARVDSFADDDSSPLTAMGRSVGRSAVGAPINVAGRLWGAAIVLTQRGEPLPTDTEARLEGFAELAATAIANAEARTELTASRARVIATADETRRRIERDLHDGAQQRLVAIGLQLRAAQAAVPPELEGLAVELERVVAGLTAALSELREYVRGIHPAVLVKGGLVPALKALARRSTVPVELDLQVADRLPERIELGAYYVISEALTNAAKHANASRVDIGVEEADGLLRLTVGDDGSGGARFVPGSGLVGLKDRVEALGGRLSLESPPGAGTILMVEVPLATAAPA